MFGVLSDGNALARRCAEQSLARSGLSVVRQQQARIRFHDSWKRPWWSTTPLAPPEYRGGMTGSSHAPPPLYSGGPEGAVCNRLMETRIRQGFSTNRERDQIPRRRCVLTFHSEPRRVESREVARCRKWTTLFPALRLRVPRRQACA